MMLSDSEIEKLEFVIEDSENHRSIRSLSLPREPSFSCWYDEDGNVRISNQRGGGEADDSASDSDFELPLLKQGEAEIGDLDSRHFKSHSTKPIMSGNDVAAVSHRVTGHANDKFKPFDIENDPKMEARVSNIGSEESHFMAHQNPTVPKPHGSFSVADVIKTLVLVLVWYAFSTFLTMYNKILLGDHLGKFPAPLLMNTVHFLMQAIISLTITNCWSQKFQPSVSMSWKDFFFRVVPTALGTAFDVNLSNASLVFISVTFATMCKSAAPIFLLLFAFAFRLESPSLKLLGIILVISVGILLTVAKETQFEFWGFVFVMMAAVMSGFRWTMTQILLQKESYGLENPLTLMSYVAPVMAVATAILSLIFDPWKEFSSNKYFDSKWHIARSFLLMSFGGSLAFLMLQVL
uniref:Sugar phosphate transporter domain-containing protein n=1 Tax=Kalanchoe fedtschenkoi TaxID=63787 RepID=A0A7N0RGV2_KALFE